MTRVERGGEYCVPGIRVLDLGPEGGVSRRRPQVNGGEIVAEGTPEKVAGVSGSFTGRYLAPLLGKRAEKVATK